MNPIAGAGPRKALLFALLAPLLLAALPACSSSSSGNKGSEDAGDQGSGLTYAPTFKAVYGEILQPTCAVAFCHQGPINPMPLVDQATAYMQTVNADANGPYCSGMGKRVVPGDPGASLLVAKIDWPEGGIPICGAPMPGPGRGTQGGDRLDPKQIAQIKSWITMGAKND
jgi:hypothetical protein